MSNIKKLIWFMGGQSIDSDYKNVLAFAQENAITVPTTQQNIAFSNFIKALKSANLWDRCKTANIFGFGSKEFGTLNLLDPTTFRFTETGTVTYADGRGVRSPANGTYFNTTYKGNQYAGIETDLTTIAFVEESNLAAITERLYGTNILSSSAATRYQLSPDTASGGSSFMYQLNQSVFTSTNHRGLYVLAPGTNQNISYKDGAKTTTSITPVTPNINNDVLFLSSNASLVNGGLSADTSYKKYAMCLFRFDKLNDAEEELFRNAWIQFLRDTRPVGATWYVRPAGGSYGLEDGTSFANAWNGFSDIDWTVFRLWDTLKVIGTHNEILTVGAPYITVSGLYEGDTAIIDAQSVNNRCIFVNNRSYLTIEDFLLQNPTTDCLGIYNGSWNVTVNRVTGIGSGNQAFQNETNVKAVYNNCVGSGCVDDGMSIHGGGIVEANNCDFSNNGQGVNAISNAIYVSNDCTYGNNSVANIQADVNSDFTINGGTSNNGGIVGNSTVAVKLNGVTRINSNISGNVIES